ncbi:MAG TPA: hypothetical protein VHY91_10175 [Pirellulales bacterium]|nr:hypothetical protein [Pirellulales bacterium]
MLLLLFPAILGLLICLSALLVGAALGKKAAAVAAAVSIFFIVPLVLRFAYSKSERIEAAAEGPGQDAAPDGAAEHPSAQPQDPAYRIFAALLSEHSMIADRARPTWADQAPALDHGVYRLPVNSGLYSTQDECRQALAVAVAQAVAQYGKSLLADPDATSTLLRQPDWLVAMQQNHPRFEGNIRYENHGTKYEYHESPKTTSTSSDPSESTKLAPFPEVTASGQTNLIEQPLYAETVETSVGEMQRLHALLELGENARAQIREAWRQTLVPRRVRWAACGFAAVLAIVGLLLAALKFDLASGGKHRARLRWATTLTILLVVGSALGLCLF